MAVVWSDEISYSYLSCGDTSHHLLGKAVIHFLTFSPLALLRQELARFEVCLFESSALCNASYSQKRETYLILVHSEEASCACATQTTNR